MSEGAREWFEWLLSERRAIAKAAVELDRMRASAGVRGGGMGGTSPSGADDGSGLVLAISQKSEELDRRRARYEQEVAQALHALFGPDGLDDWGYTTEAEVIEAHYLKGQSWSEVAAETMREDKPPSVGWCSYRARRGFRLLDGLDLSHWQQP